MTKRQLAKVSSVLDRIGQMLLVDRARRSVNSFVRKHRVSRPMRIRMAQILEAASGTGQVLSLKDAFRLAKKVAR